MSARKRVIAATSNVPTRFAMSLCNSASCSKTPKMAFAGNVNEVFVAQALTPGNGRSRVSLTNAFPRHPQIPCTLSHAQRADRAGAGDSLRNDWLHPDRRLAAL